MKETEKIIKLKVTEDTKDLRLDKALSILMPEHSRSKIQKHIQEGRVRINGNVCVSKKYKTSGGENIQINIPGAKMLEVKAENIKLDIIYEDEDLIVINKPKGMVVHPAAGNYEGTLVNALMYHCGDSLSSINGVIRPGIVHRIDKETSGLLVVAKKDSSHMSLASQLAEHSIIRKYVAIVYNNFTEDEGSINAPIGRDLRNRKRQAVILDNAKGAKKAVTHYRVLERFGLFTYIEVTLETGRTHQIRVHMSYIKHPILGDDVYAPSKNRYGARSQMLHAGSIGFKHPSSRQYMEFSVEPPEEFNNVLMRLRKENLINDPVL